MHVEWFGGIVSDVELKWARSLSFLDYDDCEVVCDLYRDAKISFGMASKTSRKFEGTLWETGFIRVSIMYNHEVSAIMFTNKWAKLSLCENFLVDPEGFEVITSYAATVLQEAADWAHEGGSDVNSYSSFSTI